MAAVADKVKSIIVEQLGVDEEEVTPDASFVDDLGADSLDTVELVMAFEEEFGIEIPDEDAEKITRVKEAVEYIEGARQGEEVAAAAGATAASRTRRARANPAGAESTAAHGARARLHGRGAADNGGSLSRRVVVTGIGLVSSLGIGTEANWQGLLAGRSGIGPITGSTPPSFAAQIAGEVKGFDPLQFVEKKDVKKIDVFIQYAIAAVAVRGGRRGLKVTRRDGARASACSSRPASAASAPSSASTRALLEGGPRQISPFFIPAAIINLAAGQVSIRFGAKGPNLATCTACSASAHAIGEAFEIIRRGDADVDDRRRLGGGHHADGRRRLRRDARALDAQRRARAGQPSVRQGPRRLRHRRGLGRARPRGARARAGARRAHLRRGRRLRRVRRRLPHHRAARGRRRRRPLRCRRRWQSAGVEPVGRRLHQRPRHLDAAQRPARDARHQARASATTPRSWPSRRPSR